LSDEDKFINGLENAALAVEQGDNVFINCTVEAVGIDAAWSLLDKAPDEYLDNPLSVEDETALTACIDDIAVRRETAAHLDASWGATVSTSPEFFYASDVPEYSQSLLEEALLAATALWGNYGPLEYWVAGLDVAAAEDLGDQFCAKRVELGNLSSVADCLDWDHTPNFFVERAIDSSERIVNGWGGGNAGRNGNRQWGLHLYSSSYPICFAEPSICPFADDQKTVFHEYFHAVQHAFIATANWDLRDELMHRENIWWSEGGAEYMAQVGSQEMRDSGVLTASEWAPLPERFGWMIWDIQEWMSDNPGQSPSTIGYGDDGHVAYSYGAWAHAYLAFKFSPGVLLDTFYPGLNELGWEGAFANTYGMNSADFIVEFDEFMAQPVDVLVEILP
jgi:hypothetical protein